jgi:ATP-dependent DNA helicase RecQ
VPAYVVFTNRELAALAARAPTTLGQLRAIPGCGEAKVARYGDELLALLADTAAPAPDAEVSGSEAERPGDTQP